MGEAWKLVVIDMLFTIGDPDWKFWEIQAPETTRKPLKTIARVTTARRAPGLNGSSSHTQNRG